jgi:sensor histidine kinase YesM
MNRVNLYWILFFLCLASISYLYQAQNPHNQTTLFNTQNKPFRTIQVGDLYLLKNKHNQVQHFFKISGNPQSDSIFITVGNPTYRNNFKDKESITKGIERPSYFQPTIQKLSKDSIKTISQKHSNFTIYRLNYPPDQFPLLVHLMYSPLPIFLLILFICLIIWLSDTISIYLSSIFNRLSKVSILGITIYFIAFFHSWVQMQGYLTYLSSQGLDYHPYFWLPHHILNSILESLPIFILFQFLKRKYFLKLPFADQEFAKFITILFGGTILQLLAITILFYIVPALKIPMINYYALDKMGGYRHLIYQFLFVWSLIAMGNFLNNLRIHYKSLRQKGKKLDKSEQQILRSQSELNTLQARINPHFLYNSLNSIASLAQINPAKTEEMALSLSEFYRYNTNRQDLHYHTIEEEINLLKTYLSIEKIRFGDKLKYELKIDQTANKIAIPRFLLQPLVENAIKYGFDKEKKEINILIEIKQVSDFLHLIVSDSGQAFSTKMDTGYGLKSIKKKLKLLYPQNHEISFINEPKKQVRIILKPNTMS